MSESRRLNSVIIVGPAYPFRGGIANLNEALCSHLNANGIVTEIVSFTLQYPSLLFPGKTQLETSEQHFNFKITRLINSINPLTWVKAVGYIKTRKPDLVVFRYWLPFMAPCLGFIARKLRKHGFPVVAIADNIIPHEKRIGDQLLTKYFIQSCDAFIVMSDKVAEDIKMFNPKKPVSITPHPIYSIFGDKVNRTEACDKLNLDNGYKYLLFFGFIRKYKGLDILLQAMPLIKNKNLKLIVAGEFYESKEEYLNLIKAHHLENAIILRDEYIPKDDVRYYFSVADLVVQPYRSATQSGVTQIAYSFDKPMVVTNVGGLPEMVTDGISGFVTDVNPNAIANAVDRFFVEQLATSFTAGVQSEKNKFGWDKMIAAVKDIYQTLLK
ncbi:MAG: glycosyltransferase [Bacteroidetes bacterium]|nr:glycosyltransferase [Bacteroidota bacterium]